MIWSSVVADWRHPVTLLDDREVLTGDVALRILDVQRLLPDLWSAAG